VCDRRLLIGWFSRETSDSSVGQRVAKSTGRTAAGMNEEVHRLNRRLDLYLPHDHVSASQTRTPTSGEHRTPISYYARVRWYRWALELGTEVTIYLNSMAFLN
jgi:hypothetical protein